MKGNYVEKICNKNLEDFSKLFQGDKCESCQCTYFLRAHEEALCWGNITVTESKMFRENLVNKTCDGYIYYQEGEPIAWCQCVSPEDSQYLKSLLNIEDSIKARIISCFYIKSEHRRKGVVKKLLDKVIESCISDKVEILYAIPVFQDYIEKVDVKDIAEKAHTGYKKHFEEFKFVCNGDNGRFYFMKKTLD